MEKPEGIATVKLGDVIVGIAPANEQIKRLHRLNGPVTRSKRLNVQVTRQATESNLQEWICGFD